jgi:hypothetical protein
VRSPVVVLKINASGRYIFVADPMARAAGLTVDMLFVAEWF